MPCLETTLLLSTLVNALAKQWLLSVSSPAHVNVTALIVDCLQHTVRCTSTFCSWWLNWWQGQPWMHPRRNIDLIDNNMHPWVHGHDKGNTSLQIVCYNVMYCHLQISQHLTSFEAGGSFVISSLYISMPVWPTGLCMASKPSQSPFKRCPTYV